MDAFYAEIRFVHIAAVLASGGLFLTRGLVLFSGLGWAMAGPIRYLSYTIDTVLLTAALMLMTIVRQYPFVDPWLTVKVLLLVVYIALGVIAFATAAPRHVRAGCWVAALIVFAFIYSVARAHDPFGFLRAVAG